MFPAALDSTITHVSNQSRSRFVGGGCQKLFRVKDVFLLIIVTLSLTITVTPCFLNILVYGRYNRTKNPEIDSLVITRQGMSVYCLGQQHIYDACLFFKVRPR